MKIPFVTLTIALLFIASPFFVVGGTNPDAAQAEDNTRELSNGWTHRPVVEHFTGLSCPPCMNGAHPDLTRLWEEEGYTAEQPWNYIEWHEYNGGGVDDLATEDTRERMRFYQADVSGTPCADMDGGYVEAGGFYQSNGCDYETVKQALEDSGSRDEGDMKMVDIEVYNSFDADESKFIMDVRVNYLSTPGGIFDDPRLNGRLFVFMLEDNVTAWSTTKEHYVLNHNVFREYAIEDEAFTILQPDAGDTSVQEFHAEWAIPTTMVAKNYTTDEYEEMPIRVPINPLNVYPVAVVYDDDDRSSGTEDRNRDGDNHRGSPRALKSATPKTTAYDQGNQKPEITLPIPERAGDEFMVLAEITDDGGDPDNAYLIWRNTQEASNAEEHWKIVEMTKAGDHWEGGLTVNESSSVTYGVMTFDSDGAGSITGLKYYPTKTAGKEDDDDEFPWGLAGVGVGAVAGILVALMVLGRTKDENIREAERFEDHDENEDEAMSYTPYDELEYDDEEIVAGHP